MIYPSVDTMEFYSENHLACGSDCDYGGSAVVQLWDIDSPESYLSFSASDSVCTFSVCFNNGGLTYLCNSTLLLLKSTPASKHSHYRLFILSVTWDLLYCRNCIFILYFQSAGSGDGTIGLFDRHLTTCQWDLVVRYYCTEVGIRDRIVWIDNVEII